MAVCCICKKKMGLFEGNSLAFLNADMASYEICTNCSKKINDLENGNIDIFYEFQSIIPGIADEKLRDYLINVCDTTKDKREIRFEKYNKEKEENRKLEIYNSKRLRFQELISQNEKLILLTTGFDFEGYKIIQYKDIISGECVLGTGFLSEFDASFSDLTGTKSKLFSSKLREAKNHAIYNLQESCYILGGNAIIGIKFDYITFINNMIGVIANGTAVVVEKS